MTTRIACVLLMVLTASRTSAQSERENIQARLKGGQKVSITDMQGRAIGGRIAAMTTDGLSLLDHGQTTTVPYDQILRIDRSRDGLVNGALFGLGAGVALALVAISAEEQELCPTTVSYCGEPGAGVYAEGYAAGALLLGGLGTAVGVAIDALIHSKRQIYQRGAQVRTTISPAIGRGSLGASASVSW